MLRRLPRPYRRTRGALASTSWTAGTRTSSPKRALHSPHRIAWLWSRRWTARSCQLKRSPPRYRRHSTRYLILHRSFCSMAQRKTSAARYTIPRHRKKAYAGGGVCLRPTMNRRLLSPLLFFIASSNRMMVEHLGERLRYRGGNLLSYKIQRVACDARLADCVFVTVARRIFHKLSHFFLHGQRE